MIWFADPAQVEQHRALHDSMRHDIRRLIDELSEEQLRTLGMIMDSLSLNPETAVQMSAHLAGRISAVMESKFNICSACNNDHDEQIAEIAGGTCPTCGSKSPALHPATQSEGEVLALCPDGYHDAGRSADAEKKYTPIGSSEMLQVFEVAEMSKYNLDDIRDEDTNALISFMCLNCTYRYATIKDRMAREVGVEGCLGCRQKAKFG